MVSPRFDEDVIMASSDGFRTPEKDRRRMVLAAVVGAFASVGASAQRVQDVYRVIEHDPRYAEQAEGADEPHVGSLWDSSIDVMMGPGRPDLARREGELLPEHLFDQIADELSKSEAFYPRALELSEILVAIAPGQPAAHYNLACCLAMNGDTERALLSLDRAIDLGWRHVAHTRNDANLKSIAEHPRFTALMHKMDRLIEQERIVPMPLRMDEDSAVIADLEIEIGDLIERYRVPGISVAVVRRGEVIWAEGFGNLDTRKAQRVQANTLFRSGAAARLLMAIEALHLHERGNLNLDAPITNWIGYLGSSETPAPDSLTARSILSSTAGLRYRYTPGAPLTIAEEIRDCFFVVPENVGAKYVYLPHSYLIVGRAIEEALAPKSQNPDPLSDVVARDLVEYIDMDVVKALDLRFTHFAMPRMRSIATGHTEYGSPYHHPISIRRPDSPVYATAGDMAQVLAFLMRPDQVLAGRAPITAESIAEIYETPLPLDHCNPGFGLGVRVSETSYGRMAEAGDIQFGVGSYMRWYPDSDCGVVVLFNCNHGMEAAQRIAHRALGGV